MSCAPIVREGSLLVYNEVVCDNSDIDVAEPQSYVKQTPAKTILGFPLHARIYNAVSPAKADSIRAAQLLYLDSLNAARHFSIKQKKGQFYDTLQHTKFLMNYYKSQPGSEKYVRRMEADTVKFFRKYRKYQARDTFFIPKTKKFSFRLMWQNLGEKPVVYNSRLSHESANQIRLYMRTKGFYESQVEYTERIKRHKAWVTYSIKSGNPIRIGRISYKIDDDSISSYILHDTTASLLKRGGCLDMDVLQAERARISDLLRNNGYYNFRKDFVSYEVDTTMGGHNADITLEVLPMVLENGRQTRHTKYYISRIFVYPNYNVAEEMRDRDAYYDSMRYSYLGSRRRMASPITFVYSPDTFQVRPRVITKEIFVRSGQPFCQQYVTDTYKHLSAFNVYKMVELKFDDHTMSRDSLNCNIFLTTNKLQEYVFDVGSTNSSGNIGVSSSLTYRHKNIFNGAETFDLKLSLSLESQSNIGSDIGGFKLNTQEYGLESRIYFPRMLLPRSFRTFARNTTPRTYIQLYFDYRQRPDYTRTVTTANLSYQMQSRRFFNYTVTPVRLSTIRISNADSVFLDWLDRLYIKDSYQDHFILGSGFSVIFNNQITGRRIYNYIKLNLSWAGNMLNLISRASHQSLNAQGSYSAPLLNTTYAQFLKMDVDYRHYLRTIGSNLLVWRLFAGIGVPYGNISSMPFTEQYFSGGANSLRAWQIRSVGPGSFRNNDDGASITTKYPNLTSDMKLEANLEYRFKVFWVVEGAWFFDAGNIWSINRDDKRDGGQFNFKTFYKEVALGTGLGLRLDFDFFLLRTDFGLKLRDPSQDDGHRWIPHEDHGFLFRGRNWAFSLGIGYPF
ncbi:MAG: BamA/TamA family outer membrane protein [Bacteroidales bacterium]|nr:BamA/TamA family outer membrane protein [Bacteroidales bacterium]